MENYTKMIRVAIVEDHKDIRESLKNLINAAPDMHCIGAYSNAEDFIEVFDSVEADVVLMDINLPRLNGISCVETLKPKKPKVQYLMCTVFEDNDKVFDSLCAGATGYVLKNTPSDQLFESIRDIFNGGSPMSGIIARKVAASFHKNTPNPDTEILSKRETEILSLLSKGYRYKEIADLLFLSTETIRTHVRNIYEKLHVRSRTEALNKVFPRNSQN